MYFPPTNREYRMTTTTPTPLVLPASYRLDKKAVLVAVAFPAPSGKRTRHDLSKKAADAEGLDEDDLTVVLRTIPDHVLAPLRAAARAPVSFLEKKSAKWLGSTRLVAMDKAAALLTALGEMKQAYESEVKNFLDNLDQYRVAAEKRLGDKYDGADIPPRWVLEKRLRAHVMPAAVTDPDALAHLGEQAVTQAREAHAAGVDRMVNGLLQQTTRMFADLLRQTAPKGKGERRRVSTALLPELHGSLGNLKIFLPDGHPQLAALEDILKNLEGVDTDDLKKSDVIRADVHDTAQAALDAMAGKPVRKRVMPPIPAKPEAVAKPAVAKPAVAAVSPVKQAPATPATPAAKAMAKPVLKAKKPALAPVPTITVVPMADKSAVVAANDRVAAMRARMLASIANLKTA
jgi:hypothetical protein